MIPQEIGVNGDLSVRAADPTATLPKFEASRGLTPEVRLRIPDGHRP